MKNWPIVIVFCVFLFGCLEKSSVQQSNQVEIIQSNIGGRLFFIPKPYLNMPYTTLGEKSGLIQAWYPGDKKVPEKPADLWKKGRWNQNVRILFSWSERPAFEKWIDADIKSQKAFRIAGHEYGLIHRDQPDGYVKDKDDLWIDDNPKGAKTMIGCRDGDAAKVPQCQHYFNIDHFGFTVSYDRKLLPHWKEIETHVIALFNSFNSEQSAITYFESVNKP